MLEKIFILKCQAVGIDVMIVVSIFITQENISYFVFNRTFGELSL